MLNFAKALLLFATVTAVPMWAGHLAYGPVGSVMAFSVAVVMSFAIYCLSDQIVLRMCGAKEVTAAENPQLLRMVRYLATRADLPVPNVFVISDASPNAFATGRNPKHASIAMTKGLLQLLNREELAGVISHELGHIRNRDTLIMTIAAIFAGAVSMPFRGESYSKQNQDGHRRAGLAGAVLAPIAAALIQMANSRSREFVADEAGARIAGDPLPLVSALRRICSWSKAIRMRQVSPAMAHMFIINPLSRAGLMNLFNTHPATEERIAKLEALAAPAAAHGCLMNHLISR